jgi:hypothetical protein
MIPFRARNGSTIWPKALVGAASSCIMRHASFHQATVAGTRSPTALMALMGVHRGNRAAFPIEPPMK